jgi:hemin uptake protein HemP
MDQPTDILRQWFAASEPIVRPVTAARGFSGARHWQVEHNGKLYILRQWPEGSVDAGRLAFVHGFQMRLASHDLPVPVPALARDGQTFVKHDGRFWEVATWMPGSADYWSDPRPEKLAAALQTLAEIHRVSELEDTELSPWRILDLPNALEQRCERLNELIGKRALDPVSSNFFKLPESERRHALETLARENFFVRSSGKARSCRWRLACATSGTTMCSSQAIESRASSTSGRLLSDRQRLISRGCWGAWWAMTGLAGRLAWLLTSRSGRWPTKSGRRYRSSIRRESFCRRPIGLCGCMARRRPGLRADLIERRP